MNELVAERKFHAHEWNSCKWFKTCPIDCRIISVWKRVYQACFPFNCIKSHHLEFFALNLIKVTILTASVSTVFKMASSFLAATAFWWLLQWMNFASEATTYIWVTIWLCFLVIIHASLEETPAHFFHSVLWISIK